MEVKKSKKADLENRRGLFMEIGLIVALVAVIIMFSVSQREKVVEVMAPVATVDEVEMIDVDREGTRTRTRTAPADGSSHH